MEECRLKRDAFVFQFITVDWKTPREGNATLCGRANIATDIPQRQMSSDLIANYKGHARIAAPTNVIMKEMKSLLGPYSFHTTEKSLSTALDM